MVKQCLRGAGARNRRIAGPSLLVWIHLLEKPVGGAPWMTTGRNVDEQALYRDPSQIHLSEPNVVVLPESDRHGRLQNLVNVVFAFLAFFIRFDVPGASPHVGPRVTEHGGDEPTVLTQLS